MPQRTEDGSTYASHGVVTHALQLHAFQADIHAPWGGVVPTLAMEAHAAAIDDTVEAALANAGVGLDDLDAVAVTVGPGLSLCLRVRVTKRI